MLLTLASRSSASLLQREMTLLTPDANMWQIPNSSSTAFGLIFLRFPWRVSLFPNPVLLLFLSLLGFTGVQRITQILQHFFQVWGKGTAPLRHPLTSRYETATCNPQREMTTAVVHQKSVNASIFSMPSATTMLSQSSTWNICVGCSGTLGKWVADTSGHCCARSHLHHVNGRERPRAAHTEWHSSHRSVKWNIPVLWADQVCVMSLNRLLQGWGHTDSSKASKIGLSV